MPRVLAIKDLSRIAASMNAEGFVKQLGPFAIAQRPPDAVVQQKALMLGAKRTVAVKRGSTGFQDELSLLLELDDLMVTTLPPVSAGEKLTVGRLPDCDVVIDDPSVSKHHADLSWDGTTAWIEDKGSSNGTWVNGDELHIKLALKDGDVVAFGDASYCYFTTATLHTRLAKNRR